MEEAKSKPITSRLIIKNIPKHFTEPRLKEALSKFGVVTDAKIISKKPSQADIKGRSRQFAYIGYKTEEEAKKTKEYFNGTYLDTSKITVDFAYPQNSEYIPRAWSRHSKDSSAYLLQHKSEAKKYKKEQEKAKEQKEKKDQLDGINKRKEKFKGFIEYITKKAVSKQSWNDVFNNYVNEKEEMEDIKEDKEKDKEVVMKTKVGEIKAKKVQKKTKAGMSSVKTHILFKDTKESDKIADEISKIKHSLSEDKISKKETREVDEKRLFVMNLPFSTTEHEINEKFSTYGNIENIFILKDKNSNQSKGCAYVEYTTVESAIDAFAHLDQTIFQGRKLHIFPAEKKQSTGGSGLTKIEEKNKEGENKKRGTYKVKKEEMLKKNYDEETNWNYLFINPNTVASAMANKLNISKGELLSKESDNTAVRLTLSETHFIKEVKNWLKANGVNIAVFDGENRLKCKRSNKLILIKNISDKTTENELRELFERYGEVKRLLVGPNNTLALVEYTNETAASVAMKKNAYYLLHGLPLYLEFAPEEIVTASYSAVEETKVEVGEHSEGIKYGRTIFVKNLNFNTTEAKLADAFESAKAGKIVSVRIVKSKTNNKSMGYGFIEYDTEEAALEAIKSLQNIILDEHSLKLSISKKKLAEKQIKEARAKLKRKALTELDNPESEHKTGKLLVKNLAFEANKKDIAQLFGSFGQIKDIRIPKKYDGTHRGFCFVQFHIKEDAKGAFEALQSSHLYGRKLIIQWAKDEELTTKEMQERTEARYESMITNNPKGILKREKAQFFVNNEGKKKKKLE